MSGVAELMDEEPTVGHCVKHRDFRFKCFHAFKMHLSNIFMKPKCKVSSQIPHAYVWG